MAISFPLPVRVAAGMVVTGWDTLRNLPSELPALSVSVAGQRCGYRCVSSRRSPNWPPAATNCCPV